MGEGQAWADTGLTLGLSLRIGGAGEGGCWGIPSDSSGGGVMKRKRPFPTVVKFNELFPALHPKQEDEEDQGLSYGDDGSCSTRSVGDATANKCSDHQKKEDSADDGTNRRGATSSSAICRKKLRLSKEQSAMLEDSFHKHPTLHPTQKLELAGKLNLLPRQVEVWFQNRRARTKLKQTEVDLEFLRRCCATLRDENARLVEELHELRSTMAITGNPRPSTTSSAARPQKMAAASCTSCMTAIETPSGSCSGGEGGGVAFAGAVSATAAVRPLGIYRCRVPSKMAR